MGSSNWKRWLGFQAGLTGLIVLTLLTVAQAQGNLVDQVAADGDQAAADGDLSLNRCIELALKNHPDLAAGRWDAKVAEERRKGTAAARWPTLSFEGSYQNFNDPQRLSAASYNGEPGVFDPTVFRNELVVRYPIYTGGRITSELAAADLLAQAESVRLVRTEEELVYNVARTLYTILSQDRVLTSLEFSRQALVEQKKRIEALLAVQKAAKVDLLRIEVRLAELAQTQLREKNNLAILKQQLTNLIGIELPADRLGIAEPLNVNAIARPGDDLLAKALERRPDFLAAQLRLKAQRQRVTGARAARLPQVSLTGSLGERRLGSGEQEDSRVAGISLALPLFDGGRIDAKVGEEAGILAAQSERLRALKQQIGLEVETARLDLESSLGRIAAVEKSVKQAEESLRIERLKYDLGKGSISEVLDAQAALLAAETTHVRAITDALSAQARLKLVTGERP